MAFAETVLGTLAAFTEANVTVIAVLATVSLGMVLLALVLMYWREPAFLTFTGQQAFDLRMLQEIVDKLPPELVRLYIGSLRDQDLQRGQIVRITGTDEIAEQDAEAIDRELDLLGSTVEEREN